MKDKEIIDHLICMCEFHHSMEDDRCTEISFYDERFTFGNTIRKHPCKNQIIEMVGKFQHLRTLNLRKCRLGAAPDMLSRKLENLDLSCNDMGIVPKWVLEQPSLKSLNLGANKIQEVPDLSNLPLETLKLHKNLITMLPNIGNKIKSLNLFLNKIPSIPNIVLTLSSLEVFTFGVTEMKSLPALASLPNLRWLTLTVSQIESLPNDICSLKNLEGLQLAKNKLKKLPNSIGEMNLKALTLYSNCISELPESFFNLKLKKLNLSRNNLPQVKKDRVLEIFSGIEFINV